MAAVTLTDLAAISDFSAEEILSLLARGEIGFEHGRNNQLLIDLDTIDAGRLLRVPAIPPSAVVAPEVLEEIVASEASQFLIELFNESLEMAIRWSLKKQAG